MALIDETIRLVETNGNLSSMPLPGRSDAETCFLRSLKWARRQRALAWELRTAVDLAALLAAGTGARTPGAAATAVRAIGAETADLQAARLVPARLSYGLAQRFRRVERGLTALPQGGEAGYLGWAAWGGFATVRFRARRPDTGHSVQRSGCSTTGEL